MTKSVLTYLLGQGTHYLSSHCKWNVEWENDKNLSEDKALWVWILSPLLTSCQMGSRVPTSSGTYPSIETTHCGQLAPGSSVRAQ